ncbi:hypothetical protein [Occultella gossypii]|uniref:Uncharacterized protein n=1 Tax=Occultella gossypii TaxID=2800820 RepID=A0ABS7S692_9MICO|nr:hypothetical protein [Occultella gossypii]MBZ2195871.1 hypothetical protein [Occultella gossypii]
MRYEFMVAGSVSETVEAAFPELTVTKSAAGGTSMYGPVDDDARVRELLERFDDLGISVVEMRRLPD